MADALTGKKLGSYLGIEERWVRELANQGVMVRLGRGKYDAARSIQGYIAFKEKAAVARSPVEGSADEEVKRERARKLKLENDTRENILVPVPDAVAAIDAIVGRIRTALSAVPSRVSDDVALRRRVETEIDAVLNQLTDGLEQAGRALVSGRDALASDEEDDA